MLSGSYLVQLWVSRSSPALVTHLPKSTTDGIRAIVSVPDSSRTAEESGILPIREWFCVHPIGVQDK